MAGVYVGSSAERWRGEDRDFVGTRGERGGGRGWLHASLSGLLGHALLRGTRLPLPSTLTGELSVGASVPGIMNLEVSISDMFLACDV